MKRPLLIVLTLALALPASVFAQKSSQPWLSDYISIDGLPRSLGVNMKFQAPRGWEEVEARRPHIVKMFKDPGLGYITVLVTENVTFFSRSEFKEMYQEFADGARDMILEDYPNSNPTILGTDMLLVDKQPFFSCSTRLLMSGYGNQMETYLKMYYTFFEDKVITILAMSPWENYSDLREKLYDTVVCSCVFTDQYSY